ncbi:MAG TPA: hypothetical protein LFV90_05000 [Rickettsia endosymbiont of Columbicola hoogstraali]|nr:hypothetical protein [Rickettsia endosymbiont of Columbicola hoogstraali]
MAKFFKSFDMSPLNPLFVHLIESSFIPIAIIKLPIVQSFSNNQPL